MTKLQMAQLVGLAALITVSGSGFAQMKPPANPVTNEAAPPASQPAAPPASQPAAPPPSEAAPDAATKATDLPRCADKIDSDCVNEAGKIHRKGDPK